MSGVVAALRAKAAGTPISIGKTGGRVRLERIALSEGHYNEAWLQGLAFEHPDILPISGIEPGFGEIVPIAREVPCSAGFIDNLYVTGSGDLVLVEAKLWRNPQARREVVAQALDYVAALMNCSYEAFEDACRKGQGMSAGSLHALVAERADALGEHDFVDAVSRNLRRGRMLVIALGDGIRSETEALAELLQSHAGAHFTFALVELTSWLNPSSGEIIALPSTLARTAMITRGIVTVEQGAAIVRPVITLPGTRPSTISEELYFEALEAKHPGITGLLKAFVARLDPLGIYPELMASLNFRADLGGALRTSNFGYITKGGKVWTDTLASTAPAAVAEAYNQRLADLIGGVVAHSNKGHSFVTTNGSSAPSIGQLLPGHEQAWFEAIRDTAEAIRAALSLEQADG